MELSKTASAFGLYRYNCDQPERDLFSGFYATMLSRLGSRGVNLTYVGAEGRGYSGKLTSFGGRTHDKLLSSHFADITVLSLAANPPGSDEPAYDSFASASLSYVDANRELLLCIVINESFVRLRTAEYEGLLGSQLELCRWDFGYGFAASAEKQPDFHILGLDDGKLSAEEYKSLCAWYAAPAKVRSAVLRDVYAYNILNEVQLNAQVRDGMTLGQYVQRQPGTSLTRLTDYGLRLWQVPDGEIARLRKDLMGSPAMIS